MFYVLLVFVLFGALFYFYVEERYFKIKLIKKSEELKKATDKKKRAESKCPAHFANHNNESRYNIHTKKFTCQFNPKHLANSGYFYNSPDICCNNRSAELNKILALVLKTENTKNKTGSKKVWCQLDNGVNCKEYNSPNGNCPTDKLTNQSMPSFANKSDCMSFNKQTVCNGLSRESCFNRSTCVWIDDDNSVSGGKCTFGTGNGPYDATKNVSVGYINGPPTAVAGNTNPFFMVSSFMKGGKDYEGGEGSEGGERGEGGEEGEGGKDYEGGEGGGDGEKR